jgi:predicted N-acetyltransferase YhbS
MEIVEFGPLSAERRRELEGDERDPFDSVRVSLRYRPKERHVALRDEFGRLVASTGLVVADVEVNGQRFPVVGLGGVIVNAQHRGRGLGRQVVEAALEKARTMGPDFVLLFCHDDRAELYRKLGFEHINREVLVHQPGGYVPTPQRTMWRSLRANPRWPEGAVVVHSLPF